MSRTETSRSSRAAGVVCRIGVIHGQCGGFTLASRLAKGGLRGERATVDGWVLWPHAGPGFRRCSAPQSGQ